MPLFATEAHLIGGLFFYDFFLTEFARKGVKYFTPDLKKSKATPSEWWQLFSIPVMPHTDREYLFGDHVNIETRLRLLEEQVDEKSVRLKDVDVLLIQGKKIELLT